MTHEDEIILRRMLWLRHGCALSALYGDDGEMQCSECRIDFLRDAPQAIHNQLYALAIAALAKELAGEETKA